MQTINMLGRRIGVSVSHITDTLAAKLEKVIADDLLLSVALLFLPIIYMLAALSLITNVGLGRWVLPAGLLLWVATVFALHRDKEWQKIATQLLMFLAAFALIALVTSQLLDTDYIPRVYHYSAVQALLDGENPFYTPVKWESYAYPAAHWLLSASLILWTNSIEASCAFTAPAIFTAFICAWRFIATLNGINRAWRIFLAFLLATNPVAIWTLFNHHVDGMLASVLLSFFMLMLTFLVDGNLANGKNLKPKAKNTKSVNTRRYYVYITASLILLINIKITGLAFGAILGIVALAYGIAVNSNIKQVRRRILQLISIGATVPILAIIFFGYFPYATHTPKQVIEPLRLKNIYYEQDNKVGNIFKKGFKKTRYKYYGQDNEKLENTFKKDSAATFYRRSNYEKWWVALFSKKEERIFWNLAQLPPFSSLAPRDFGKTFGSFFSGAMLLCLTLVLFIRNKAAWIIIGGIFVSIFTAKIGYSFRQAPQNWWIPIMILVFFLAKDGNGKFKSIPINRAHKIMVIVIAMSLLQSPVRTFLHYARESTMMTSKVSQLRRQGGWYATVDEDIPEYDVFFQYYASGLTAVRLPALEECPEGAQMEKIRYGLLLCRPQK